MNRTKYLIPFLLILIGCHTQRKLLSVESPLYKHVPSSIDYDTLRGTFFYENFISSYLEVDVVLKSGGFIKGDSVTSSSYREGYYVIGANSYVQHLKNRDVIIKYDEPSIANFFDSLLQRGVRTGTYKDRTNINPFCGAYYKKYNLEVEVLFIDTVTQIVPLFMNCEEYKNMRKDNKGKNYEMTSLPTFIITRILSWEEW